MIDKARLNEVLTEYKKNFLPEWWKNEKYKWEAVKCFKDNWDVNADNFKEMLDASLKKTGNLLGSAGFFPKDRILKFAVIAPETVRDMFVALFDENIDVIKRIETFKTQSEKLLEKYNNDSKSNPLKGTYQDEKSITTYLWLRYPDKYTIFQFGIVKETAEELKSNYQIKKGEVKNNVRNFLRLHDEISKALKENAEIKALFRAQLTETCYPDPELKTLTIDVAYYLHQVFLKKDRSLHVVEENIPVDEDTKTSDEDTVAVRNYWWLNANPKIWSFSDVGVGKVQSYTFYNKNGNKRRIFQNFLDAKPGDMLIGYEATPVKQIVAIGKISAKQEGESLEFEKTEGLASPVDYAALKECPELRGMEYFRNSQGSLFKLTKEEYDFIMDLIREENPLPAKSEAIDHYSEKEFLSEVFMTAEQYNRLVSVLRNKKNIILQGAPGVGKTFAARRLAWSMMGAKDDDRIGFVQLHQNYSYEDFMMGYRPVENGFELKYGIFYRFCQKAANQPDKDFFFIIDEINRGNLCKIFGELLMLIENDYRGVKATLAYNGMPFAVPKNLYIIGMMNTADRSLAMLDYALRRRFSFFDMEPGFDTDGFKAYQVRLGNKNFDELIAKVKKLNQYIKQDKSLGKGFCIGHSYFCGRDKNGCTDEWLRSIIDYDILPMISEYWFDDANKLQEGERILRGA